MEPGEEAGLLASLRERALQYEEAVRTVRRGVFFFCSTMQNRRASPVRGARILTRPARTIHAHPRTQAETARLDAWRAERPEIKAFIAGLAESRAVLRRELARVEAATAGREAAAAAAAAPVGPGGVTTGFNVIR
jgi:hypothetical protein